MPQNLDEPLILAQRARALEVLRPILDGRPVALLDFPDHGNPGDSLVWLGELALLEAVGVRVAYTAAARTYDREALAARVGDGPILLHGGGNFGELWDPPRPLRERVLADFPRNRVIQLPQSVRFSAAPALARARTALGAHPDVHLLARDEASLAVARGELGVRAQLCPDLAFGLGPQPREPAAGGILWLARTDQESIHGLPEGGSSEVIRVDWVEDEPGPRLDRLAALSARILGQPELWPQLFTAQNAAAEERAARGRRLLSRGAAVVTDRLHGHILATLLGIPHVILDNSTGKLGTFHRTWTSGSRLAVLSATAAEAMPQARTLAARAG